MTDKTRHVPQSYFPFGSQYYRAPSPERSDWASDMKNMADMGFNSVKFWVQWRWNHPEEDRMDFSDIDELMDIAHEHGLRVMLNTIVDVAPAWIWQKYPDASMISLDGTTIGPQTQPHRQIGGLGLSLCHEEAQEHMFRFLEATFERYSDHPALEIWNFGSEPELTQSMAELRKYADDAALIGDMLDYNPHAIRAFKKWLEDKYETIDRLNTAWNRNYTDFSQAEVPRTRNTFNDVIDWRMFFVHVLGENVKRRYEIARSIDQGRHPLMCHHVFIQGFPLTSTANDPWNVAQYGDLHGFTQMDDAMMHDILRSSARGKEVISAEMLMLMGYTLNMHDRITMDDIKRHIYTGVAANLKGFIFWQYRPEALGREAPAWGLSELDGRTTPWLDAYAEVGRNLEKDYEFLHRAAPRKADVAIVYNPENQIFAWAAGGSEKLATDSMLGLHRALYERNFTIDFVHAKEFTPEILGQYDVILNPFPYVINADMADALKAWVHAGGCLVGEAWFAGWDIERGRHHTTVPGYGFHEVFGARQREALPEPDGMRLSRDLGLARAGERIVCSQAREVLDVDGADVWARFDDGEAAVTHHTFGKGQAVLIGSYVSLPYHRSGESANGRMLAGIVERLASRPRPEVEGTERIRVDVLSDAADDSARPASEGAAGVMVIVQNLEDEPVRTVVSIPSELFSSGLPETVPDNLPDNLPDKLTEQYSGDEVTPYRNEAGIALAVSPGANEVLVYRA